MAEPEGDFIKAVVPSDATIHRGVSFLRIGGAGNLVLEGLSGAEVTIAVGDGEYVPFTDGKVKAATTATGIVIFA